MLKPITAALAVISVAAIADTTIYFEDGTSLITESNVYLSDEPLFSSSETETSVTFSVATPVTTGVKEPEPEPEFGYCEDGVTEKANSKGTNCDEYVEPEPEVDPELAEIQYCQNFDTSQGLTFNYVNWQQQCDTNRDGEYKFCEDWVYTGPITFQAVWWNRACIDNPDFTPVN